MSVIPDFSAVPALIFLMRAKVDFYTPCDSSRKPHMANRKNCSLHSVFLQLDSRNDFLILSVSPLRLLAAAQLPKRHFAPPAVSRRFTQDKTNMNFISFVDTSVQ
jgi:hypothetical protein